MERKKEALRLIESIVGNHQTAEVVLERLQDEGFLHLGYGDADVDRIVGTFKEAFGNTVTTKYDRIAANRLANAHTSQAVVGVIKLFSQVQSDQYAPSVGSVAELEKKWVNIIGFLRKRGQKGEVIPF